MRRWILVCCCIVLLGTSLCAEAAEVETSAVSAILVDGHTGRVLYEKNAHEVRLIASITKLMTALVAVESTPDLSAVVTVQPEWLQGAEGSSIYLAAGEEITLEALLYGMLLESGNDAAQVVAGYCGGDVETFVSWMNEWAAELGMRNSHFVNPSGLNAEGHYSTAFDMSLCAMACMDNEIIAEIVATPSAAFGSRVFHNHNKLLNMYDGCVGMKTGYTERAGRTLVTCAQRDGQRLIAVTLTDPNDWEDHMAMYDYGFAHYPRRELCRVAEVVRTLPVKGSLVRFVTVAPAASLAYPLKETEEVTAVIQLPDQVEAPVQAGGIAGKMEFYLDDIRLGSTYLVFTQSVKQDLFAQRPLLERILGLLERDQPAVAYFSRMR